METRRHKEFGSSQPILTPSIPFHTLTIDFVLCLPKSPEGLDCILTITCKFSKRKGLVPGKQTWTAKEWAAAFLRALLVGDWGIPCVIISDRDRKFVSDIWKAIFDTLKTDLLYSASYHPQTDGQSERTNQSVEIALRYLIAGLDTPTQWPNAIPFLQHLLNSSPANPSKKSPHEIMYGMKVNDPTTLLSPVVTPQNFSSRIEAREALRLAAMDMKRSFDKSHTWKMFSPGDEVLIRLGRGYKIPADRRTGAQKRLSPKLQQQFSGPFKVIRRIGRLAYKLDIPDDWRIDNVFPISLLEPWPSPDPYKRHIPDPEPLAIDDDGVGRWEIEKIVDKRITRRGRGGREITEYRVRWAGFGPDRDWWLPEDQLEDAKEAVADYEAEQQEIPIPAQPSRKRGRPRRVLHALVERWETFKSRP
jgi:hypothetical protein